MHKLVIATWNKEKRDELSRYFQQMDVSIQSLRGDIPDVKETGATFIENARLKAEAVRQYEPTAIIVAEDSGLCVDALDGFPNVRTARFMEGTDDERAAKVLQQLGDRPMSERTAVFQSAVVILFPDGLMRTAVGKIEGWITYGPVKDGQGYGGIFILCDEQLLAENIQMARCNHRSQAIRQAVYYMEEWLVTV